MEILAHMLPGPAGLVAATGRHSTASGDPRKYGVARIVARKVGGRHNE
ncbi:MAG: hypothetical protein WAO15_04720 [Mycobacterium sp.]